MESMLCLEVTKDPVLLQRLEVLEDVRPLDVPNACLGAVGMPELPPNNLFAGAEAAGEARLREMVQKAQFWISLLEGEHSHFVEEVEMQRKRRQLAVRQAEAKASALREAEGERRRLVSEMKRLQQSRDEAICERHALKEDGLKESSRSKIDAEAVATRCAVLEAELDRERGEKADMEAQLVKTKVRYAEALQRADSMEVVIHKYEGQLKALNPSFEPVDLSTLCRWMPPSRSSAEALEVDSNSSFTTEQPSEISERSKKTRLFKGAVKGVLKMKSAITRRSKHKEEHPCEHQDGTGSQSLPSGPRASWRSLETLPRTSASSEPRSDTLSPGAAVSPRPPAASPRPSLAPSSSPRPALAPELSPRPAQ